MSVDLQWKAGDENGRHYYERISNIMCQEACSVPSELAASSFFGICLELQT